MKVLAEQEKEIKEGGLSGVLGIKCLLNGMHWVHEVSELLENSIFYIAELGMTLLITKELQWI